MIVDRQGRRFRNLRISLTSACNYACTYCVPNGKRLVAAQDELSAEAMARGVAYLIEAAGIERLRITGGEPLVSPKLEAFMGAVGGMGLSDISLTTNGQLLARKLPLLVDAGIRRINVSLDTLDANAFRSIARGGDLATVLDGMDQARAAGMTIKVKLDPSFRWDDVDWDQTGWHKVCAGFPLAQSHYLLSGIRSNRIRLANSENASMPASPLARLAQGGSQRGGSSVPSSNSGAKCCTSARVILPANSQRHWRNWSCCKARRKNVCTSISPRRYTVSLVKAEPPPVGTPRNTRWAEEKLSSAFCPAPMK